MKRFKGMVIGGIQNKIVNLILFTVLLLTAAFIAVASIHSGMLANLASESGEKQREGMTEVSGSVMDEVVRRSMRRGVKSEAEAADRLLSGLRDRVAFLADFAEQLLAHPEYGAPGAYSGPDPAKDGEWTLAVVFAEGTDPDDPAVAAKAGLLASLSDMMISMCREIGAPKMYIGTPEGIHLTVGMDSSGWMENGKVRSYDPRQRAWYRKAEQAGSLIFTGEEIDFTTGSYCLECAMPVYGPDGSLQAVAGTDLYLDGLQEGLLASMEEGETLLLVDREGKAALDPLTERFPLNAEERQGDLRASGTELLAETAREALDGKQTEVKVGILGDGKEYYLSGMPIETTGWALLSAVSRESAMQPAAMLRENYGRIEQETAAEYESRTARSRKTGLVLLLTAAALTLTAAIVLGTRIVNPLNAMTRKISELQGENLEFRMEDAFRTGDEVEELAQSFANLSQKTLTYMDTVKRVTAEKERVGTELSLATQIQASMLPHIFPAFPDRQEFDIYARMDPAREVGGDFYDYFLIDPDHLGMVIADVSGKGVPAALFMMASKIILQSVAMMGKSPAEILAHTNAAICSNNEAEMFVTVWVGILELSTGRLTAANAGHEFPALKQPDGLYEIYKDRHGFVLGGMEDVRYTEYELTLQPGARLFVYTDGLAEATNEEKQLFGTERILNTLNAQPEDKPMETLKNMQRAVDAFVGEAEQFDDLTMMCLEFKGLQS